MSFSPVHQDKSRQGQAGRLDSTLSSFSNLNGIFKTFVFGCNPKKLET